MSLLNRFEKKQFRIWAVNNYGVGPQREVSNNEWRKFIKQEARKANQHLTAEDIYNTFQIDFKEHMQISAQMSFRNSTRDITTKTSIPITLDINNDADIDEIKSTVIELLNEGASVLLMAGEAHYTLNAKNLSIFDKLKEGTIINTTDSEERAIVSFLEFNNLDLIIYPKDSLLIDDEDEAPRGEYFKYNIIEDFPIDLNFLDIYKQSEEEDTSVNCLVKALTVSGLFTTEKIESIKVYIKNRATPTKELRKVAERLNVNITIRVLLKRTDCRLGYIINKQNTIIILVECVIVIVVIL